MKKIKILFITALSLFVMFTFTDYCYATTINNPRVYRKNNYKQVIYDSVLFGSYPQAEVVSSSIYYNIGKNSLRAGDLIVNPSLYQTLQNASWNSRNETIISGITYRRMSKNDALFVENDACVYNWAAGSQYHYFRYEPIRWRVLSVDNQKALLLADRILDDFTYCKSETGNNQWATSNIRSWLNGYGASSNQDQASYLGTGFINTAFSATEKNALVEKVLSNQNVFANSVDGGVDTKDKIFLLKDVDMENGSGSNYGFFTDTVAFDEARMSGSSTYAKARGLAWFSHDGYAGNSYWWLRSSANDNNRVLAVTYSGGLTSFIMQDVVIGARPALVLDLSQTNAWRSNGTITVGALPPKINYTIPATDLTLAINGPAYVPFSSKVNVPISFNIADPSVAIIDSAGKVTPRKIGTTTVTIRFAGNDDYLPASKQITVKVVPKKSTLTSVKSKKKGRVDFAWKKDKTVDGYELNFCTNKTFNRGVLSKKVKNKTTKANVGKLKSKKIYYFRVRSYKKMGGKTYWGFWSNIKKVRVK